MSRTSVFRSMKPVNGKTAAAATMRRLKAKARQIETLEQLAAILAESTHPKRLAAILRPMLRPNLPCCQVRWVSHDFGQVEEHTPNCPRRTQQQEATA